MLLNPACQSAVYTSAMLRMRVVNGPGLFQELEGAWKGLCTDSPGATPFQTYEWQSTWWRHYGGLKQPRAYAVYDGQDLVGLLPMVRTAVPWRTLRPMGIGPSDYLHPLAMPGYEERVAAALTECLSEADVDLVDLHQVRETRAFAGRLAVDPIEQATCLVLDLPATYDAYLQTLGKSLRYDVRKLDKSLFKEGKATIEPAEDVDQGLDILFEQHRLRWRKRGLPGAFLGRSTRFHREWAHQAARQGWLWLSVLRLEGEPIGAIYAMTHGATVYYYQAGFDPTRGSVSPGTLLVAATIRRAIEAGKGHFDFMRGDEPYKRRWKPQHVLRNYRYVAPAKGLLGRAGSTWNQTGSRVEKHVRARLEGRGLL
jgi:CelD/BcsL family acetyltransferase involved in cellulose biosynthesis